MTGYAPALRQDEDVVYTVSWSIDESNELSKNVTRFDVSYCSRKCIVVLGDTALERSANISLEYFTHYSVTVLAVYDLELGRNRTVLCETQVFQTVTGKPEPVTNFTVAQTRDTLDMGASWEPPEKANGIIEIYELQIVSSTNVTQRFK